MDGLNPTYGNSPIQVSLTNSSEGGPVHTSRVKEIRRSECYPAAYASRNIKETASADLALLILETPKPNAQRGVDYIDIWDDGADGDIKGAEFALMGWGRSGDVNNPDAGLWRFHRGYNVVESYQQNRIAYNFDDPAGSRGLPLEGMCNSGDSGGAATIERDGTRKLIGACSWGYTLDGYRDPSWELFDEYTSVSGWHRSWIMANIASPDERIAPTDQNCNGDVYATCQDTHFDANGN